MGFRGSRVTLEFCVVLYVHVGFFLGRAHITSRFSEGFMIPKSLISIGLGFDFKVTIFLANFLSHYLHHLPMLKSLDKVHLVSLQYCQEFRISICL